VSDSNKHHDKGYSEWAAKGETGRNRAGGMSITASSLFLYVWPAIRCRGLIGTSSGCAGKTSSILTQYQALLVIVLYACSYSVGIAQDRRDVPFDTSDIPSVEKLKMLLESSDRLDGLSEEEKQQRIDYAAKYINFSHVMLAANAYSSCQVEIERLCSAEPKQTVNSCLFRLHDKLGACCASNIRRITVVTGIPEPMVYEGITLPKGSELNFYDNCQLSEIWLSENTQVGDVMIAAGKFTLNASGGPATASIVEGQIYKGLPIENSTEFGTEFYVSGVPSKVSIAEDINYLGMQLEAGSQVSFYENGVVQSLTTNQPFTDSQGRVLTGQIEFHPSGTVKTGNLATAWKKSKIELPAKSHVTFNSAGEFELVQLNHEIGLPGFINVWGDLETHANGQIKQLYLQNQSGVAIDGVAYAELSTIVFAEDGRVVRDNFRDKGMTPSYPMPDFRGQWQFEEIEKATRIGVWEFPVKSILVTDESNDRRSATLADKLSFQNIALSSGHIEFQSGGSQIWGATLTKPYQKNGLKLPAGADVSVHIDGFITFAQAMSDAYFNDNRVAPNSPIRFHKSGAIHKVKLEQGAEMFGFRFSKKVDLQFNQSGELYALYANEPVTINYVQFDGDGIFFHPSSYVRSGILNIDMRIANVLYAAGTEIILNERGEVIHSWRRQPRWPNGKPPEPQISENFSSSVSFVTSSAPGLRMPLMGPLTNEKCAQMFGEPDASGNYTQKVSSGFSLGNALTAPQLGCGTTDEQAGILERD